MSTPETLQQLKEVRRRLLQLHKMLLDQERAAYEKVHGSVSSGELLQLLIDHEQFAWLHSISELIVRIDEAFDSDDPMTLDHARALLGQARTLLLATESEDPFQRTYFAALQHNPDAVLAHKELMQILSKAPSESL